jgi:hypothetical protein
MFEASLDYTVTLSQKQNTKSKKQKPNQANQPSKPTKKLPTEIRTMKEAV